MSVTSDEVNLLVYRYLQESGFSHSAFTFLSESNVRNSNIADSDVPLGALVSYLQKGLLYSEMQEHIAEDGTEVECRAEFSLVKRHVCDSRVKRRKAEANGFKPSSVEINPDDFLVLSEHSSEVFICSWNKSGELLASGSGDSTARIWKISGDLKEKKLSSVVLDHGTKLPRGVTSLDWGANDQLATGTYDGSVRIWSADGELQQSLRKHSGPVFSLKWNQSATHILSGSADCSTIIWDAHSGEMLQKFEFHNAPALDVDWRDNTSFASCSVDKMIYVCELGKKSPVRCFQGHSDEVNCLKWDCSGRFLASCSDDHTAKVWSMQQDSPCYNFQNHTKAIYALAWSPTGPGSQNPDKPLYLASASFDKTVNIYDIESGKVLHTFERHTEPVYSVSFSPDGSFIASGSFDRCMYVWSVKTGDLVKSFTSAHGGIFEVKWNPTGDRIAACYSDNTVAVVDINL